MSATGLWWIVASLAVAGIVLLLLRRRSRFDIFGAAPEYAAAQILETMKSAVLVVDMEGRIRGVNRAAGSMLGYEPSQLLGQHARVIFPRDEDSSTERIVFSGGTLEQSMVWRCADGSRIDVMASSSFVRDRRKNPVGAVYVAADYTERKRAETALRESETRYRTLFELNPLPMWVYDLATLRFLDVNDAALRHYGYERAEFLKISATDIRPAEDVPSFLEARDQFAPRRGPAVHRHKKKDGTVFESEVVSFQFESSGRRLRMVIAQDITERRKNEDRYRLLFERNLAGVYRTTLDGRILDCNDALAKMFGYDDRNDLLSQTAHALYTTGEERRDWIERITEAGSMSNVEVKMRRRDGTPIWILENVTLMEDGVLQGTLIDITDRKNALQAVEYQAFHDALTGLPNRLLFRDRITVALPHAKRMHKSAAVMFLDLDHFKVVNDTLGHTIGDHLLREIAARLVSCIRAEDTVARMGGDEFTILLSDIHDRHSAAMVAQKVLESIRHPIHVDGHELYVTASIGIAVFPDDGTDAESLLRESDRAMYRAKDVGRNNYHYATPAGEGDGRLILERNLHHALDRGEFIVHYQPIVEIASGRIAGAEALVRWVSPERGIVQPEDFIPIAEDCNLIVPLGEWVMRTACAQMKAWRDEGHQGLRVSVNISFRQLQQHDFAAMVEQVLAETGLPADALDLEITESGAMQNTELTMEVLNRIRDIGVRISIDDFGTGYSSLSYLKRFPIDTVKIDQHFVRDASNDADAAIISAVISIARALQLDVVAEGVETAEQLAFLRHAQCHLVQGFLHSQPLSADDFAAIVVSGGERSSVVQTQQTP